MFKNKEEQFDFYWKEIFTGLAYNPIEFNTYRFDQTMSLPGKVNKLYDMFKVLAMNNQEVMDYLKVFVETFDVKLYETIEDVLTVWLEDGRLADVVRVAISEEVVEARTDYLDHTYLTLKERLDLERKEVILARGESQTLVDRLDTENAEVTSQLIQTGNKINNFILLSDYADNTGQTIVDAEVQSAFNYAIENKLSVRVDGKFKLTQPLTIPDKSIPALFGDGVEQSALIFDIDGDDYALTVQTYHTHPLKIKDLTIQAERVALTVKQNGLKVEFAGFGGWGGSIQIENVFINRFTGVLYNATNTFNSSHHNLQLYGANVEPYVATLLKVSKTNGIFSNNSEFVGCGFQYGKIAIQNLGGANYSFVKCQFEHLTLFLHTPLITNPGVSNHMYFRDNWFEQIEKGIINADMNELTLEPINPISNRSDINFLSFDTNYDGGRTPTNVLDKTVEPVRANTFTFASGSVIKIRKFSGWLDITLQNGWTGSLKAYRQSNGLIHLVGNLTPGTISEGTKIATLPFRSEGAVAISALNGNSTVINSNAFWISGDVFSIPASANYGGAPHTFSIMYYEKQ